MDELLNNQEETPLKKVKEAIPYSVQKNAKRFLVLTLNCEIIGIWGNLRKLCSERLEKDFEFPKYTVLVRKKENPIKFETLKGSYIISNEKPN